MSEYRKILLVGGILLGSTQVQADAGVMFGLAYTFGDKGGAGLTVKLVSTREEDKWAAVAGFTWYPQKKTKPFGVDVGVGYVFRDAVLTVGWDFLHSPQIGVGYVDTETQPPVPPVPPVPPALGGE